VSDTRADGTAAPSPDAPASPPPLPPLRTNLGHLVAPVTGIWFVLFVVLLFFVGSLRRNDAMIWLWTSLAGWSLGVIGLAVYGWQRWAARRGTRSSQQMALDEEFGRK
jgi:hypothetical protein